MSKNKACKFYMNNNLKGNNTMDYISEIFARLNVQQIRSFLLYGADDTITEKSYTQRLKEVEKPLLKILNENFNKTQEEKDFVDMIHAYASINADVYMEIGIICGASLVFQMITPPKET